MTQSIVSSMTNLNRFFVFTISQTVKLFCRGKHKCFIQSLNQPAVQQEKLLRKLLLDLSKTEYGRLSGISGSETYEEFARKMPIVDYDALESLISKQIESKQALLTPHRVVHIEPTSGSSGASKKILYTKHLLDSFSNMFCIWAYDLLSHGLNLKTGKIFLSISPSLQSTSFASDANYLDGLLSILLTPFIVSPRGNLSGANCQQKLAETILLEEKLEMISIWSPSYLLSILRYIETNRSKMSILLPKDRAQILQNDIDWQKIFPHLQLISCWDSAHSATVANQLAQMFPAVKMQGKGLLATEAPITVPITGTENGAPLIDDVFLELEDENGVVIRLHDSKVDKVYQVILSQRAGLTRYRLNDFVMVGAPLFSTPTLKFIGKANIICDMVGEKLNESFVRKAFAEINQSEDYVLVPVPADNSLIPSRYTMLSSNSSNLTSVELDLALCRGFHYQQARRLGQLSQLEVLKINGLKSKLQQFFQCEGQKLGAIKDLALIADINKAARLLQFLRVNSKTADIEERHHDHLAV